MPVPRKKPELPERVQLAPFARLRGFIREDALGWKEDRAMNLRTSPYLYKQSIKPRTLVRIPEIKPSDKVLFVMNSFGHVSSKIPGRKIHSDADENVNRKARKDNPGSQIVTSEVTQLPFKPASFDWIASHEPATTPESFPLAFMQFLTTGRKGVIITRAKGSQAGKRNSYANTLAALNRVYGGKPANLSTAEHSVIDDDLKPRKLRVAVLHSTPAMKRAAKIDAQLVTALEQRQELYSELEAGHRELRAKDLEAMQRSLKLSPHALSESLKRLKQLGLVNY